MSNCNFSNVIDAYHDGELPADQVAAFETHLRDCDSCVAELSAIDSISKYFSIASNALAPISTDAVMHLHEQLDGTMQRSLLPLMRNLIGLAASILVASTIGLMHLHDATSPSAPQAWEGAMLVSSSGDASQSSGVIEPNLILADLSRDVSFRDTTGNGISIQESIP